ncbi:replication initiation and membrane attachment family protein [Alkalicoccus urumqiensis]|uniref:Uncharacterized protein n=1 Tax=Alkalicoccus urumqiensis TaxID=1548213 RepID=A0A2P6MDG2_ALKUR|nr:DnaD domain protein [Alkalicoccus urumqiensis]PRO64304.1 hypothetical protein C6I21_15325 [Alkalicoccus urumqiensis]
MHWQEITPATPFTASAEGMLSSEHVSVMMMLYQPLIGPVACSLYITMMTELSRKPGFCMEGVHKQWMTQTGQHLSMLYEERKKLEAIGLLSSYKEEEEGLVYLFSLPYDAPKFFQDELLSIYLYNRAGSRERYRALRAMFTQETPETEGKQNITKSFNDVFSSLRPSEMRSSSDEMSELLQSAASIFPAGDSSYEITSDAVDMQTVDGLLPKFVSREEVYAPANQKLIQQTAFLYQFTAEEMAALIQDAMLHTDSMDAETFRSTAKRRYRLNEGGKPPMLGLRKQPPHLSSSKSEPASAEEQQIHYFDTTSPLDYLHTLSGGAKVYEGDIDIVESLLHDYGLQPGVVNVLIDYLYMVNNGKLVKNLAFKIASHWKRKKVDTVKEAMKLAKEEHEERQTVKTKKAQSGKQEAAPVPSWLSEQQGQTEKQEEEPQENLTQAKQEAARYRELLRKKKQKKG